MAERPISIPEIVDANFPPERREDVGRFIGEITKDERVRLVFTVDFGQVGVFAQPNIFVAGDFFSVGDVADLKKLTVPDADQRLRTLGYPFFVPDYAVDGEFISANNKGFKTAILWERPQQSL